MRGTIKGYGKVEFDPFDHGNNVYDLYSVAVFDPDTNLIVAEENYLDEDGYRSALRDTYGREVMHEQEEGGFCEVVDGWGEGHECECTHHVAYVIDRED